MSLVETGLVTCQHCTSYMSALHQLHVSYTLDISHQCQCVSGLFSRSVVYQFQESRGLLDSKNGLVKGKSL